MFELFAVPWSEVDLSHVETFFADAGEEGINWEAKADDDDERKRPEGEEPGRLKPRTIQKAACGLANQIGGFLILGARWDKKAKCWHVPGVVLPDAREPELWIGKALRGLNPVPRFDTSKTWKLAGDRVVSVIWIEPVDEPPCMTPLGHVYERVSGETIRVSDPALLDALFRRGREARGRAEQFAERAALRALDAVEWKSDRAVGISVALASIGRETDDISSRLFITSFRDALSKSTWDFFSARIPAPAQIQPTNLEERHQQDALAVVADFIESSEDPTIDRDDLRRSTWVVQATWDGAVAASATFNPAGSTTANLSGFDDVVMPGWRAIVPLVELLGGYGPAVVTLAIHASQDIPNLPVPRSMLKDAPPPPPPTGTLYRELPESTIARRWVAVADPTGDVLGSLQREIQRAAGISSFEPEVG